MTRAYYLKSSNNFADHIYSYDMKSLKVIIFDIDGTLLNTDELYFQLLKRELSKLNISINEQQFALFGLDDSVFHVGLDEKSVQKIRENILREYYNDQIFKKLRFKEGALKVVCKLAEKYLLAIGSGEKLEQIERYLQYQHLGHYFQFIGHGGLVHGRKSNPEYFHKIARFFKVKPEECLMVGDSKYDIEAVKSGCTVVIIPSKFTKHCVFDNDCVILSDIKELMRFLEIPNLTKL